MNKVDKLKDEIGKLERKHYLKQRQIYNSEENTKLVERYSELTEESDKISQEISKLRGDIGKKYKTYSYGGFSRYDVKKPVIKGIKSGLGLTNMNQIPNYTYVSIVQKLLKFEETIGETGKKFDELADKESKNNTEQYSVDRRIKELNEPLEEMDIERNKLIQLKDKLSRTPKMKKIDKIIGKINNGLSDKDMENIYNEVNKYLLISDVDKNWN